MARAAISSSRREILKMGAMTSAGLALRARSAFAKQADPSAKVYVTSGDQRHAAQPDIVLTVPSGRESVEDQLVIDAGQQFQPMLGFGSAFTDASCFLLQGMAADVRRRFIEDTFSPQAMNLSVGRSTIGASDYSRELYSYDDVPGDTTMAHFSVAHDEAYILPILREIRQVNPELFLLASPWSPPGWMKTYGSMMGGWMEYKSMAPYAEYLSRFLDAYRAAGVPIQALTCQNEIETDQGGSMPATYWPPELEADFVRDHLGPLLRAKPYPVQIWLLDHNYDLWKRVRWQMQDARLRPFVDGVAWHGYLGSADMVSRLHDSEPNLAAYWTEGGPDYTDPKYTYDWVRWGNVFTDAIANGCRCLITWNLVLDAKGKPNIGPFSCGGLVTLNSDGTLTMSGQYWTLRHLSQHVRRHAVRISSRSDATGLRHLAFRNPDNSIVVLLTNGGEARTLPISLHSYVTKVSLEKESVTTLLLPASLAN